MKTQDRGVLTVISEARALGIPIYQRPYEWEPKEVSKLLEDTADIMNENSDVNKHFVGNIITHPINRNDASSGEFITDGQQRLTTLTLVLIATTEFARSLCNKRITPKEQITQINNFVQSIKRDYISKNDYRYGSSETILKLKQSSGDDHILNQIVDNNLSSLTDDEKKRQIYKNYKFILSWLNKNITDFDNLIKFVESMRCLYCVKMELDEDEDPQRIFESMNTNGKPISVGAQINNYMINKVAKSFITYQKDYEELWKPIENLLLPVDQNTNTKRNNTVFFKEVIQIRNPSSVTDKTMYSIFKNHIEKSNLEIELNAFLTLAKIYNNLEFTDRITNKELRIEVNRFNNNNLPDSLIMKILFDLEKGLISEKIAIKTIRFINIWADRLTLSGDGWSSLENTRLQTLYFRINYHEYFNMISRFLLTIKPMPSNEDIKNALEIKTFKTRSDEKIARNILIDIESSYSKDNINWNEYSLEHIYPQKPQNFKELTPEKQRQLRVMTYKLGNLTLSPNNSELSNKDFIEKRDMPNKPYCAYKNSQLKITNTLAKYDSWGEDEVNNRTKDLIEIITKQYEINEEVCYFDEKWLSKATFTPLEMYESAKSITIREQTFTADTPSDLFKFFIYTLQNEIKRCAELDDEFKYVCKKYRINFDNELEFSSFVNSPSALFRSNNTQIYFIRLCLSYLSKYLEDPIETTFSE